jgi:ATP-dependent DNA ligase
VPNTRGGDFRAHQSGSNGRQRAREAIGYAGLPRSIRLISRNGHNLAERFPLATAAIEELSIRSCVIDGETTTLLPVCHDHSA